MSRRSSPARPPIARVRSTEGGAKLARVGALVLDALTEAHEVGERSLGGGAPVCTGERFPMYSPWAVAQVAGVFEPKADATPSKATSGAWQYAEPLPRESSTDKCRSISPKATHFLFGRAVHQFYGRAALSGVPTLTVKGKR